MKHNNLTYGVCDIEPITQNYNRIIFISENMPIYEYKDYIIISDGLITLKELISIISQIETKEGY